MAVKAIYMGEGKDGFYLVNVRTANPTGNIGDAGFIRRFPSKDAAKNYTDSVNKTGEDTFIKNDKSNQTSLPRHEGDVFVKAK